MVLNGYENWQLQASVIVCDKLTIFGCLNKGVSENEINCKIIYIGTCIVAVMTSHAIKILNK